MASFSISSTLTCTVNSAARQVGSGTRERSTPSFYLSLFRGTEGSNPSPSSAESANFRFLYDRSELRQSRFRRGDAPVVSSSLRQYIGDPALERGNRAPARHRSAPHRHQAKVSATSSATSSGLSSSPGLCCARGSENQHLYASIGYEETGRGTETGYDRVFMRKQLRG
jgi:hypothetical protein